MPDPLIRTPEALTRLVAETREPVPPREMGQTPEWTMTGDGVTWRWTPRHQYATDIAAAKRLQEEMLAAGCTVSITGKAEIGWRAMASRPDLISLAADGETEAIALCLLWLAWKGVDVRWQPEVTDARP